MKNYLKALAQQSSSGFTLIELLVAMAISTIVISIAGFGLVTLLDSNNKAEAETLRRTNLNRALDFIADDIRMANKVSRVGNGYTLPGGGTGVLLINIPSGGDATDSNPTRLYFVRASTNTWVDPQTINRATGSYSSATTVSGDNVLIDAISDITRTPTCPPGLPNLAPASGVTGFYACLDNPTDARVVELHLIGKSPNGSEYEVKTKVFARSASTP